MKSHRRWVRVLRVLAVTVAILVFGLAAFVQVQQRLLRWRAERLLADIRAIQMGKSSWADAQRMMRKWGAWGAREGSCSPARCDYQIVLADASEAFASYFVPSGNLRREARSCCRSLHPLYRALGGRPASVAGRFIVRDGVIWAKDFSILLDVAADENRQRVNYTLMASATTVSQFSTLSNSLERVLASPEFQIGMPGGCEGCEAIYARFTPFADSRSVDSTLADFQLDCLVRWRPCSDPEDVMPNTWNELHTERAASVRADAVETCSFPKELLGRDDRYVTIAEVVSNRWTDESPGRREWTTFRLGRQLKGPPIEDSDITGEVPIASVLRDVSAKEKSRMLRPGAQMILAFDNRFTLRRGDTLEIPPCGILPFSADNLAAVQRGIERDVLPLEVPRWPF